MPFSIVYRETKDVDIQTILELYRANKWSSANKPQELYQGLLNSDSLITAWHDNRLVGLANAISDGHLVVYYPHVSVHPEYQRKGIGTQMMKRLMHKYNGFHQQTVVADKNAVHFFQKCDFVRAGETEPMWIFAGDEHS